jgi:hypothetical protein
MTLGIISLFGRAGFEDIFNLARAMRNPFSGEDRDADRRGSDLSDDLTPIPVPLASKSPTY